MSDAASPATVIAPSCKNCAAPLGGAYCAACGQESRIETPTVGEFVREFVQDQMALEGKLLRTLKLLVTQPGAVTLDYILGRRQCYIRPLRLYLALSVVFFGVSGLFGHSTQWMQFDDDHPASKAPTHAPPPAEAAVASAKSNASAATGASAKPDADPVAGDKEDAFAYMRDNVKTGYAPLDVRIRRFFSQTPQQASTQIGNAVTNDAPVAMFFLLPLFAGLLQLAYLRHHLRYGVHLLFSLHYHAFVFLDLLLLEIPWPSPVDGLLRLAIPIYLLLALRRVYGGKLWTTGLGVALLLLVYSALIGITLFAAAAVSLIISA